MDSKTVFALRKEAQSLSGIEKLNKLNEAYKKDNIEVKNEGISKVSSLRSKSNSDLVIVENIPNCKVHQGSQKYYML